ncbi:MAG: choice-of-anchor B family protein [Saprospiraceae bacterium]|nr:choice-of-anchor B family protein [Saprospiraceae bacterium]MCB9343878.1 choice-of-anchor B family protein [Lewinellaceae bacterium]
MYAQELELAGHLSYAPLTLAGCWHYVDNNGGEWALVGTKAGMSIVDVNNPEQPVERFKVPGIQNNWREMTTWNGFAYVGSEAVLSGVTIVDLRQLPDTIMYKTWLGDAAHDTTVVKSHALKAADGYLYIFGAATLTNGAIIADLSDPWNPEIIGTYTTEYVHDGYIRGDTLWTSEIYKGQFGVVDVSDKANPKLLQTQPTPGAFNHNTGLSDDGQYLFTADERVSAPLGAFDVANLDNITLLDTYLPTRKPEGEVHNVRVFGDFLVNACYRGQLTIVDASRPENLIETAWDSLGNSLVWDVDPYLPSGIILATAKSEGLYIYRKPPYSHACWLEGTVSDFETGFPLSGTKVFVLNTFNADTSSADGGYKTGNALPGIFEVYVEKEGYIPKTISNVQLKTNEVIHLDIQLSQLVQSKQPGLKDLVKVSPSPFSDYVQIKIAADKFPNHTFSIRMFDQNGHLVHEKIEVSDHEIKLENLQKLPVGAYWLSVETENEHIGIFPLIKLQ